MIFKGVSLHLRHPRAPPSQSRGQSLPENEKVKKNDLISKIPHLRHPCAPPNESRGQSLPEIKNVEYKVNYVTLKSISPHLRHPRAPPSQSWGQSWTAERSWAQGACSSHLGCNNCNVMVEFIHLCLNWDCLEGACSCHLGCHTCGSDVMMVALKSFTNLCSKWDYLKGVCWCSQCTNIGIESVWAYSQGGCLQGKSRTEERREKRGAGKRKSTQAVKPLSTLSKEMELLGHWVRNRREKWKEERKTTYAVKPLPTLSKKKGLLGYWVRRRREKGIEERNYVGNEKCYRVFCSKWAELQDVCWMRHRGVGTNDTSKGSANTVQGSC